MRLKLPKPLKGWRAFAGEVGVIVLGVLIALGLGKVAEDLDWRSKVADSWVLLHQEFARTAGVLDERRMMAPCFNRRLEQLDVLLRAARTSGRLPQIGEVGRPGTRPIQDAVWESLTADGTLVHFDPQRQAELAVVHTLISRYRQPIEDENRVWARFFTMERVAGPVSDQLLADLLGTLAEARYLTDLNNRRAEQYFNAIKSLGIRPNYYMLLDREDGTRDQVLQAIRDRPVCKSLLVNGRPFNVPT